MKNMTKSLAIAAIMLSVNANSAPVVVDFAPGTYTQTGDTLDHSHDVTFSSNLYTHSDGFNPRLGGVFNFYGERNEYITFANQVSLTSIDFSRLILDINYSYVDDMTAMVYNQSDDLISTVSFTLTNNLQTVAFEFDDVSKVVFNWIGQGADSYADGRDHSWFLMDNISYDTANNLYSSSQIPTPTPLALLGLGLAGLGLSKTRKKQ